MAMQTAVKNGYHIFLNRQGKILPINILIRKFTYHESVLHFLKGYNSVCFQIPQQHFSLQLYQKLDTRQQKGSLSELYL